MVEICKVLTHTQYLLYLELLLFIFYVYELIIAASSILGGRNYYYLHFTLRKRRQGAGEQLTRDNYVITHLDMGTEPKPHLRGQPPRQMALKDGYVICR